MIGGKPTEYSLFWFHQWGQDSPHDCETTHMALRYSIWYISQEIYWGYYDWRKHSTKNCRQLRKAGSGRYGLPRGRKHQIVVQCQRVYHVNRHADNVIWTQKFMLSYIYVYILYKYIYNNNFGRKVLWNLGGRRWLYERV